MQETLQQTIELEGVDPLELYGVNNAKYNYLSQAFPTLRIVARDTRIAVSGPRNQVEYFCGVMQRAIDYYLRTGELELRHLQHLVAGEPLGPKNADFMPDDAILYAPKGKIIKARTPNQRRLVESALTHDLLFAVGPAGSGKTYTAIALAVSALKARRVKRIILTRPAVEAGERLGFLPGDMKEKLDPYLQPLFDALNDMLPPRQLQARIEDGSVQIAPLAYMRGRTLDNAFVILDEAQNATKAQIKMFLTRMGRHAKFIVTGDITQIDLPDPRLSGLTYALNLLKDVPGIAMVHFQQVDIVRHPLVTAIVEAFAREEEKQQEKHSDPTLSNDTNIIQPNPMSTPILRTELTFSNLQRVYHGKVRDAYFLENNLLAMVVTDRISAFDVILPWGIPYKGAVLNAIAAEFLDATRDIVPNWKLSVPHPMVTVGIACEPLPVEMVIRGYLSGHAWREYQQGKRVLCGVPLPEGLRENDPFPQPIITPTTKAMEGHDEDISAEEIIAQGLVSEARYRQIEEYTRRLFARGTEIARERGLILVDTKYEFGVHNGEVYLIDEIHTPDSSRYFYSEGYEARQAEGAPQRQLSKEFVRQWLIAQGFQGQSGQSIPELTPEREQVISQRYIELYEQLLGKPFERVTMPPMQEAIADFLKNR